MKKITLLSIFLSFTLMHAAVAERPETFCDSAYGCTDTMRTLSQEYAQGDIGFIDQEASAFSGACYHLDSNLDANYEHHGAFVFRNDGYDIFTNGMFYFFYNQDPYQGQSKEEVLANFGGGFFKTIVEKNQVLLSFPGDETNIAYWFRSIEGGKKLILIGREVGPDYMKLIFCKLNSH